MCFCDRIRRFTFSDGCEISLCPDCLTETGHECLRQPTQQANYPIDSAFWESKLSTMNDGRASWLDYRGNVNDLLEMQAYMYEYVNGTPVPVRRELIVKRPYTPLDDQEWVDRQKPFQHSRTMPRKLISYCVACVEVVVDSTQNRVRTTKGVYQPIEHDCGLRVYDLHNNLLEVRAI